MSKLYLRRFSCVNSPLVMAPRKRDGLNPRLLNFSMVVDERLDELLITTIFAPQVASFSTVLQCIHRYPHKSQYLSQIDTEVAERTLIDKNKPPYQNAKANS